MAKEMKKKVEKKKEKHMDKMQDIKTMKSAMGKKKKDCK